MASTKAVLAQWFVGCFLAGIGLAWLATRLQAHFAPVVLFPLLVGGALGAVLGWWSQPLPAGRRREPVLGIALAVAALVAGQHVFPYVEYRRAYEQARSNKPELALFESLQGHSEMKSFPQYLSGLAQRGRVLGLRDYGSYRLVGWQVWLSWLLDAGLEAVATVLVCRMLRRRGS